MYICIYTYVYAYMHVYMCKWLFGRHLEEGASLRRGVGTRVGAGKDGEQSRGPPGPRQGLAPLPITLFGRGEEETMETSWPGRQHGAGGRSFFSKSLPELGFLHLVLGHGEPTRVSA